MLIVNFDFLLRMNILVCYYAVATVYINLDQHKLFEIYCLETLLWGTLVLLSVYVESTKPNIIKTIELLDIV